MNYIAQAALSSTLSFVPYSHGTSEDTKHLYLILSATANSSSQNFVCVKPGIDNLSLLRDRLNALAKLSGNWNSYEAEAPNFISLAAANSILTEAHTEDFLPDRIDPSVDGGIVLKFSRKQRYADIECFNTGEVLAMIHVRHSKNPEIWGFQPSDTSQLRETWNKIQGFIHG